MLKRYKSGLYCFSPPVMLATCVVEICLALYMLWRYKLTLITRLIVTMLIGLAIFQMAEYMVCGGLGLSAMAWARIGFVAITTLPALGVHMAFALSGRKSRVIVWSVYALSLVFMAYFLFAPDVFAGSQCLGNYVIFQLQSFTTFLYTIYYYGLLFYAVGLGLRFARSGSSKQKRALQAFVAGYVLFMLPTAIVNSLSPATLAGIPSIMCGFAVLLALVMVGWVAPFVGLRRKTRR